MYSIPTVLHVTSLTQFLLACHKDLHNLRWDKTLIIIIYSRTHWLASTYILILLYVSPPTKQLPHHYITVNSSNIITSHFDCVARSLDSIPNIHPHTHIHTSTIQHESLFPHDIFITTTPHHHCTTPYDTSRSPLTHSLTYLTSTPQQALRHSSSSTFQPLMTHDIR
jgi:hypothetical protein